VNYHPFLIWFLILAKKAREEAKRLEEEENKAKAEIAARLLADEQGFVNLSSLSNLVSDSSQESKRRSKKIGRRGEQSES